MSESAVSVKIEGLLFDMDGVLISSVASANRCWRQWAAIYGVPNPEKAQIKHGTRAIEIMKTFKPDITAEQLVEGLRIIEDLEIADVEDLKVLAGVPELLQSIPVERWSIVTSATRRLLMGRLQAAHLPIPDRVIAGDDVVNGKPHPEPYMTGARLLGYRSEDCIVVEDALTGVGSGVAAKSRVLGVLGTHAAADLYAAGAEWVVESLAGVRVTSEGAGLQVSFTPVARD